MKESTFVRMLRRESVTAQTLLDNGYHLPRVLDKVARDLFMRGEVNTQLAVNVRAQLVYLETDGRLVFDPE